MSVLGDSHAPHKKTQQKKNNAEQQKVSVL